jgi:hypothetical protein
MLERGMASYGFDPERFSNTLARGEGGAVARLALATEAVNPIAAELDDGERVRALVADPAFQLK